MDDEDDLETYEIFGRDPPLHQYQRCLYCGAMVLDEDRAVWVVNGPKYSPFCNFAHRDMCYKHRVMGRKLKRCYRR